VAPQDVQTSTLLAARGIRSQPLAWAATLWGRALRVWRTRTGWRTAVCVFVLATAVQTTLHLLTSAHPLTTHPMSTQIACVILALSGLMTALVTLALDRWVLEPLYFLRDELLRTVHDPEDPRVRAYPYSPHDEVGQAIAVAHKLIAQNARNVREIKNAAEGQIHRLAYYDTLTGLPNRTLFLKTLEEQARAGLEEAGDKAAPRMAIITLDIDHFKDINDSMGHEIGDSILRALGRRLRAALPPTAMVARTGEDEFAIMMSLASTLATARDVAERVASVIRATPFAVLGEEFQVRASIGVTTFPDDAVRPDEVLKNADIALNRSKELGRDTITEYSQDFDHAIRHRFQMLRDLRAALEGQELTLHFQPQISLVTGQITGAEALIRWWKPDNSPEGGRFISPGEFIPVAEHSGLILPIGAWVLAQACEAAASWSHEGGVPMRVGVNVSPAQFMQSDLCETVERVLADTGLDPRLLELEVTESLFMEDVGHTIAVLNHLHTLGVELAIDDFGTGYSSLSYLRQFPIDRLKIDRSFIKNALTDPDDAAIARTIVRLGHSLGLKVIAEGVETQAQERFLLREGCDEVQGFYYCRPMPEEDLLAFVRGYTGDLNAFSGT
jgi:diguanylate cyclase (GGDEF)-like protein